MRTKVSSILAGLGLAAALSVPSVPALAHHAFGGEFDPNKPVLLKGKITTIEWVNPHAWIHIEIPKADGPIACQYTPNAKCEEWMVEGGTPNTLLRRGITKDHLYEYACHEGNYAMGNILRGARLRESEDTKTKSKQQ